MKALMQFFLLCLISASTHAALITAEYSFDGTNFTLENGEDIFTNDFNVGDTLTLSLSAKGNGSYWDLSDYSTQTFEGFDLGFTDDGTRAMDGYYNFYHQGSLVDSSYFYSWIDENRAGPYSFSVRDIDHVDFFTIEYRFLYSSAESDQLASFETFDAPWFIFSAFGAQASSVPFVNGQAVAVSEPHSLLLFVLCLLGVIGLRKAHT